MDELNKYRIPVKTYFDIEFEATPDDLRSGNWHDIVTRKIDEYLHGLNVGDEIIENLNFDMDNLEELDNE